jgi:sugar/nucleoside kinase (ribokinase family)
MSLVVVGSADLDTVETPCEKRDNLLGGSAVYFSVAASFFTNVCLASVVGEDWPQEHTRLLQARGIDTSGLQVIPGGKTFRWHGRYAPNFNDRETIEVHLNVLTQHDPVLPEHYRRCQFLFLANGATGLQLRMLEQCPGTALTVADTMDLWIRTEPDQLAELLRRVDGLVLNDSEAKLLSGEQNLVRAGRRVRQMGPRFVIIKKGEHGAMFFGQHETYVLPAYPTADVVDPTGAGDAFAGGMMGYLAEKGQFDPQSLKQAIAYGTVTASFTVEGFSLEGLLRVTRDHLDARLEQYKRMVSF